MIVACSVLSAAPSAATLTFVVLKACGAEPKLHVEKLVHVYSVRLTAYVAFVESCGGLLPRRSTSDTPPFSTIGPSGASENLLKPEVVQLPGVDGVCQYVALSVVQKLVAHRLMKPLVVASTASRPFLSASFASSPKRPI